MAINVGDKIYANTLNLEASTNNRYFYLSNVPETYYRYSYSGDMHQVSAGNNDERQILGAGRYKFVAVQQVIYTSTYVQCILHKLEGSSWVSKFGGISTSNVRWIARESQPRSSVGKKLRRLIRSDAFRTSDGNPYYSVGNNVTAAQVNAGQIVANG